MQCHDCDDEVDEIHKIKAGGKTIQLCEDCADRRREKAEIAGEAESVMQGMMEYKGR